jgi:hypothetical protein
MVKSALLTAAAITLVMLVSGHAIQGDLPLVNAASNPTPRLEPGGPGVIVDLRGANLDRISSVQILSNGQVVKDVAVTLGSGSPATRSFTFKALAGAQVREAMILRISDGRRFIDIPPRIIQIEVAPVKPLNTRSIVDTNPKLIDTTKATSAGPVVTSLAINGGAASTAATRVTLNMSVQNASYYRASESSAFTGASWQSWTITAVPSFDLSPGNGTKTVYVQVKNMAGVISPTASDTIILNIPPAPTRQEYTISGGDAYTFSQTQGFKFSYKVENPLTQLGQIFVVPPGFLELKTAGKNMTLVGSRCDFVLFDGRELKDGWIFKSYDASTGQLIANRGSSRVDERPTAGSRTIRFRIHLWTEAGSSIWFDIHRLKLEGPAGQDWREAFR